MYDLVCAGDYTLFYTLLFFAGWGLGNIIAMLFIAPWLR